MDDLPAMLTPAEIGRILRVDPKTVTRWARDGKLAAVRTPGGHWRFPLAVVLAFLRGMGFEDQAAIAAVRNQVTSSIVSISHTSNTTSPTT
jgi:excisionase family DNA binding protein